MRVVESRRVKGKVRQKTICGIGTSHKDDTDRIENLKSIGEKVIISMKNEERPALIGFEINLLKSGEMLLNQSSVQLRCMQVECV